MNDIFAFVLVATVVFLLLSVFIVSFFLILQKRHMDHFREKTVLQAQYAQELLQTQFEVQNLTLQQVSQELHDNIGQLLSVARINLNILEELNHPPETFAYIRQTNEIIDHSIHELRSLTKSLDGDFVREFGLEECLANELLRIKKTNRFETEISVSGSRYDLGYEKEIVLFRIAQEMLNNILKHANASQIWTSIRFEPQSFLLSVSDNGVGFIQDEITELGLSGAGIRNMARRASLIGGNLKIDTAIGEGTRISVEITNDDV